MDGAANRDRTGTVFPPRDFKSLASASSAMAAYNILVIIPVGTGFVKGLFRFFHLFKGVSQYRNRCFRERKGFSVADQVIPIGNGFPVRQREGRFCLFKDSQRGIAPARREEEKSAPLTFWRRVRQKVISERMMSSR